MSRALVTFAAGDYRELARVSRPPMERYAARHGWELFSPISDVLDPSSALTRPPSWWKLPLLQAALSLHDEVLWLDTDVIIVDDTRCISDVIPSGAWQALVAHHTADGEVPSCGVWYLRPPMQPLLAHMWELAEYTTHGWWEQAALLELLGYQDQPRPVRRVLDTGLYRRTQWLDLEWNSHESADRHPNPRFAHATCGPTEWRLEVMRTYAAQLPASTGG